MHSAIVFRRWGVCFLALALLALSGYGGGGGSDGGGAPATNTWSAAGSLATARYPHIATLLPNGQVLVAGGISNAGNPANAEFYDPATNTWSAAGSLATARTDHTATLLPNGHVLVAGGFKWSAGMTALAN